MMHSVIPIIIHIQEMRQERLKVEISNLFLMQKIFLHFQFWLNSAFIFLHLWTSLAGQTMRLQTRGPQKPQNWW